LSKSSKHFSGALLYGL